MKALAYYLLFGAGIAMFVIGAGASTGAIEYRNYRYRVWYDSEGTPYRGPGWVGWWQRPGVDTADYLTDPQTSEGAAVSEIKARIDAEIDG